MKKLLIPLLIIASLHSFGQTTSTSSITTTILSTKDTLKTTTVITTSITSKVVYDTAISKTVTYDTLKYVAPVTPPIINPGGLKSNPVTYSYLNGTVITGLSFDGGGNATVLLTLKYCKNVHVTLCKFTNTKAYAVYLINCTNCTVDYCYFNMVQCGTIIENSVGCKWNNNQLLNLCNPVWSNYAYAHAIQLRNTSGGGQQINYNRIENINGVAVNPHDIINVYHSNGLPGDSIMVIGNWIRGGQYYNKWPGSNDGAAGIILSDEWGNYQVARNNILVNPGAGGIGDMANNSTASTSFGIKIDHNIIYSQQTPVTGQAMGVFSKSQADIGYNITNWTNSSGGNSLSSTPYSQYWLSSSPIPLNWGTNKWVVKTILPSILPAVLITWK